MDRTPATGRAPLPHAQRYTRQIGEVSDFDGVRVHVGVDYDCVVVGRYRLTRAAAEEFARLYVAACWEAGTNAERMAGEV